jgi:hypothetical protein
MNEWMNEWMCWFWNTQVTKKIDPDAFVPYRAMNYFDRFLSRCDMTVTENSSGYFIKFHFLWTVLCWNWKLFGFYKDVEGRTDTEKVHLIAISCFTISAKMWIDSFSVDQFLSDLNVSVILFYSD